MQQNQEIVDFINWRNLLFSDQNATPEPQPSQLFTEEEQQMLDEILKKQSKDYYGPAETRPNSPAPTFSTDASHVTDSEFYIADVTHQQAWATRQLIKNRRSFLKKHGSLKKPLQIDNNSNNKQTT